MPTTAQLDRLKALLVTLTPLAGIQRGDVIKAADWNTVVGSLIDVARAVLADDTAQTVPPHEHPDQVKASWLDPSLRTVVLGGVLADPAAQSKLGGLQRTLDRLTTRADTIEQKTTEVHDRIAAVTTSNLARQAEITAVRRSIDNIGSTGDDVLQLRTTLQSVQQDVATALNMAKQLTVDGQPIDFNAFNQRLVAVEQIGISLRLPNGALLDAQALENRLTELTNTLVTQQQLDDILSKRPANIPQSTIDALRDTLTTQFKTQLDASNAALTDSIRAETTDKLAGIDAIAARAVADASPALSDAALAAIRPEIAAAAAKALTDAQAAIGTAITATTESLRAEIKGQLDAAQATTTALIGSEIDRVMTPQIAAVKAGVTGLQTGLAAATARQAQQDAAIQTVTTRVEAVARDGASAQSTLKDSILAELSSRFTAQSTALDAKLTAIAAQQQQRLDASITEVKRSVADQISAAVSNRVVLEIGNAETRINANMVGIAHDQVAAAQDQLQASVNGAVASAMQALPGVVSAEVRRQTANVPVVARTPAPIVRPTTIANR